MKRLLTFLAALAVLIGMQGSMPDPAAASLNVTCSTYIGSSSNPVVWRGWESPNSSGRTLCVRGGGASFGYSNLDYLAFPSDYTPCNWYDFSWGTWADCVSADQWSLSCTQSLSLYRDPNYSYSLYTRRGSGSNSAWPSTSNDKLSSVYYRYDRSAC
jgi:hypothetical protein